jgi:steroid 5-alpha reductase family enzyme
MFATTFAAAMTMFATLWVASLILRDASIVDRFWGLAFLVIASSASASTDGAEARAHLVMALVTIWGFRLSLHITVRNLGGSEDDRYAAMRRRWGKDFAVASLVTVFALQGTIAWIVSLPVQVAVSSRLPPALTALDYAGLAVWSAGFAIETIADYQLAGFKADQRNEGLLMDRGLWRYSRHPNYFGDCVVWWGFFLFAAATGAWWTAVGPALMTFLLVRVSGVAMLERGMRRRHDDYEDYCRRTSAFVPLPPRTR